MKKKKHVSLLGWLFYIIALAVFAIGFIGLFARQFEFEIPILSDKLFPIFDKYNVSTPGWASPGNTTDVVVGHHWVFLICLGISIVLAIFGKTISAIFIHLAEMKKQKKTEQIKANKKGDSLSPKERGKDHDVDSVISSNPSGGQPFNKVSDSSNAEETSNLSEKSESFIEEPASEPKNFDELTKKVSDIIQ